MSLKLNTFKLHAKVNTLMWSIAINMVITPHLYAQQEMHQENVTVFTQNNVDAMPALFHLLPAQTDVLNSLKTHPWVQQALFEQQKQQTDANMLRIGHYTTVLKLDATQRYYQNDHKMGYEPFIGVERTFRLPQKKHTDEQIANHLEQLGELTVGDAWHEASKNLLDGWFNYLQSLQVQYQLQKQSEVMDRQLKVIDMRIAAGDAPQLERMILQTESASVKAALLAAQKQSQMDKLQLQYYFKGNIPQQAVLNENTTTMPSIPTVISENEWIAHVLADNHEYQLAQKKAQIASAQQHRYQQNLLPDPTISLGIAKEQLNTERTIRLGISVPIGFGYVKQQTQQAQIEAQTLQAKVQFVKTRLQNETQVNLKQLEKSIQQYQIALLQQKQVTTQNQLLNKAYILVELQLNEWLLGLKQYNDVMLRTQQSYLQVVHDYARMYVDSHQLWAHDDDHTDEHIAPTGTVVTKNN